MIDALQLWLPETSSPGGRAPAARRAPENRHSDARAKLPAALSRALSLPGEVYRDSSVPAAIPGCVGIDVKVLVPYGRDYSRAMAVILEGCRNGDGVLDDPVPDVRVAGLADSGFELVACVWSRAADAGTVTGDLQRAVAGELSAAGFETPPAYVEVGVREWR